MPDLTHPRGSLLLPFLLLLTAGPCLYSGQTRTWIQGEFSDFQKGILKDLSLRSDGVLTLAPRFQEVFDSSAAYLWALAQDSHGNLYTGGGPGAKLYRISPKGDKKMLAELDGLEVHAIAVDAKDRVYAATSPDSKIYRIAPGGKAEVFYDPKTKYVWAMAFDRKGNLFVATGDQGEIHRVTPDGKGSIFFKSDESHARSLVLDGAGNLIVGTDPGGLVLRISPDGRGFVLYQMAKKEITAVAVAPDGSIYAAGVGSKQAAPLPPPPIAAPAPASSSLTGAVQPTLRPAAPPPATLAGAGPPSISGGSELYRIDPSGNPRRIWSDANNIVYAIGFDPSGKVLVGTGNKGSIFRIDSDRLFTVLLNATATQITAFLSGAGGRLYATTGNVGKVYEIGPDLERQGSFESDVFDAGLFSLWGRLSFEAEMKGGSVAIVTRSGNLDQPQKNWSPWSAPITSPKGARLTTPPARFVQWKATLTGDGRAQSPELESVEIAYLPKNLEPHIEEIEITPVNHKFPNPQAPAPAPQTLNLPPLGRRSGSAMPPLSLETSTPAMQSARGFIGARWTASDENGDTLVYTVQIRGSQETEWKLLKDKVREKYLSWDSTAFPDGEYRLRIIASDLPSNPPPEALSTQAESDPFLIDNTPPRISRLAGSRNGARVVVRWKAEDALNNIKKAEYSLDGGDWIVAPPVSRLSDSPALDYELTLDSVPAGEHTVAVRVEDDYDNQATDKVVLK